MEKACGRTGEKAVSGRVYLVGAGCAGRELLTVRALELLHSCDTVVYDALIDPELLIEAPQAEKLPVGKRAGRHSEPQESINALLVKKALEGKTVVRLKGGDPFVFGRGGEEALVLAEHDIPYETVPGISSAIAAAELAGIPVTHRNTARSFHVITAHTSDAEQDFAKFASLDGTLVFLMGLAHIAELAKALVSGGMSADTPAAVVSRAGRSDMRTVRGNLSDIAVKCSSAAVEAPAVIIVGQTAALELLYRDQLPLSGVSVSVSGSERFLARLSDKLSSQGAAVRTAVRLSARTIEGKRIDSLLKNIGEYSWLAFTSVNGVEIFFEKAAEAELDLRSLYGVKLAAVGKETAKALRAHGLIPELTAGGSSASLGKLLAQEVTAEERVMLLRASNGTTEITEQLSSAGIGFDDVAIYDTAVRFVGSADGCEYIVFSSPSGVECYFNNAELSRNTAAVCIGDVTAEAFRRRSDNRYITAKECSAEGIVNAILEDLK